MPIFLTPAIIMLEFEQYLVICDFIFFQYPVQHERRWAEAIVVLLCVILSA